MDIRTNIKRAIDLAVAARREYGADLAVFPESVTTGFTPGIPALEFHAMLEPVPGAYTEDMQNLAKDLRIHIVWPLYEKGENGIIYNSAVLIDEKGEILGHYRKTHPFPTERLAAGGWTTPGKDIVVCETKLGKIGLMICYDGDFPELARVMAIRGAEIIVRPSAFLRSFDLWEVTNCARAYDNHVYIVAVNAIGQDAGGNYYFGHSMIVSPIAQRLAQARAGEEIIFARLDPEPIKYVSFGSRSPMIFDHLQDRNVEVYGEILQKVRSPFEPSRRIPY